MYFYIIGVLTVLLLLAVFGKRLKQELMVGSPIQPIFAQGRTGDASSTEGFLTTLTGKTAPALLCDSTACVRCNKNVSVVANARRLFKDNFDGDEKYKRVERALFDENASGGWALID